MSTEFGAFQSGLEAVKQGRYSEAIHLLENFCQICQVGSQTNCQEYLHAQMGLVKAYHCIGEHEQARVLCQQLAASKHPQVQAWALHLLPSLSASGKSSPPPQTQVQVTQDLAEKSPLTPDEAAELLTKGNKALKFKRYAEAVEVLHIELAVSLAAFRSRSTSRIGGAPNSRLYSRLKCESSSYPTW